MSMPFLHIKTNIKKQSSGIEEEILQCHLIIKGRSGVGRDCTRKEMGHSSPAFYNYEERLLLSADLQISMLILNDYV